MRDGIGHASDAGVLVAVRWWRPRYRVAVRRRIAFLCLGMHDVREPRFDCVRVGVEAVVHLPLDRSEHRASAGQILLGLWKSRPRRRRGTTPATTAVAITSNPQWIWMACATSGFTGHDGTPIAMPAIHSATRTTATCAPTPRDLMVGSTQRFVPDRTRRGTPPRMMATGACNRTTPMTITTSVTIYSRDRVKRRP